MKQVAIAFATTGPSPKAGHHLHEILAVELEEGKPTGNKLRQVYKDVNAAEGRTFAEQYGELDAFIGDSRIVVHQGGAWKKFLRVELRTIKNKNARRLLRDIDDVAAWAHTRFPKQRKDLASLGKKVGANISADTVGLERDVALLAAIALKMRDQTQHGTTEQRVLSMSNPLPVAVAPITKRSLGARLSMCWRVLVGQA